MTNNIIATYGISNNAGMAIFDIVYGIDDFVLAALFYGDKQTKTTKNKIHYNSDGRAYFIKFGCRYYLDEFMHV